MAVAMKMINKMIGQMTKENDQIRSYFKEDVSTNVTVIVNTKTGNR